MAEGGQLSEDPNQEVDDGITGDAVRGRVNEISGGTHKLTIQGGEFGQFIQKQENQSFQADSATGKTRRPLPPGALRILAELSLLEKEPISTSSRVFHAILHSDVTGDKKVVAKITRADKLHQREAKIHFSVRHHKNIVERILADKFDFRGQPSIYIAMESCDCSLDDHVKSQVKDKVPFDSQKYLSISHQIVVGLSFLHSYDVVHGDLKPGNVLLILDENLVKLCDFGLSRAISDDKTSTQLTSPHGGTTGWLAPECVIGTTKLGFKNDIFPLGLVSFYCWSYGKHPYGDESYSWNHYIVKGENRNLEGMLIPDAGSAKVLLEWMLEQNAADRPTAKDVLKHEIFAFDGKDEDIARGVDRMNLSKSTEEKDSEMKADGGKTGQGMSDEDRKIKVSFLREKISALLWQSKHLEASRLMDELASLQPTKELGTSLQMAECFLHLGREKKAYEAIVAVRHLIVTSHALSADDVFSLGCNFFENSSSVRAIILLRIASDLYKTNASSPDDVVNGIYNCMSKTYEATQPLIKAGGRSRVIGLDFGVEYMEEMYKDLSDVKNAEPENKTLKQAWSLHYIGLSCHWANEHEKRLKLQQIGVELVERQFGSDASKYLLYGRLLNNTGTAYRNLCKFSDAAKYHEKSIKATQKATDYSDESRKRTDIEFTKSNLNKAKLCKI